MPSSPQSPRACSLARLASTGGDSVNSPFRHRVGAGQILEWCYWVKVDFSEFSAAQAISFPRASSYEPSSVEPVAAAHAFVLSAPRAAVGYRSSCPAERAFSRRSTDRPRLFAVHDDIFFVACRKRSLMPFRPLSLNSSLLRPDVSSRGGSPFAREISGPRSKQDRRRRSGKRAEEYKSHRGLSTPIRRVRKKERMSYRTIERTI